MHVWALFLMQKNFSSLSGKRKALALIELNESHNELQRRASACEA